MNSTDLGHEFVAYLSAILLLILLAAYAPWALAAMLAVGAPAGLWYALAWPTDADIDDADEPEALAGDTRLTQVARQYGGEAP